MADKTWEFDLQTYLRDMRTELINGHTALDAKMTAGFEKLDKRAEDIAKDLVIHTIQDNADKNLIRNRLEKVESIKAVAKWAGMTAGGSVILWVVAMLLSHFKP